MNRMSTTIRVIFLSMQVAVLMLFHAAPSQCGTHIPRSIKIALVQMEASHKKDLNLEKIKTFTINAASRAVSIICFPELSITGYESENPAPLAEPVPGPSSNIVSRIATENNITILAGLVEKDGDCLYISHLVAFPEGRIEVYRKTHLGDREEKRFCPGQSLPVFKTKTTTGVEVCFAIGICYDMHFPEIASVFSLKGAQIIFSPHASPLGGEKRIDVWNRYIGARAYDNTLFTAACNHITRRDKTVLGAGIAVWDPVTASIIKKSSDQKESILICDLDLVLLKEKRSKTSKTFFLKDRREQLYFNHQP